MRDCLFTPEYYIYAHHLQKIGSRGLHVATSVGRKKSTETVWHATLTRWKYITYALAFIALLFLVLIDVGGNIRSPTPAAQDLRVLVDSLLILSNHVNSVCKSAFFSVSNIAIGLRNIWTVTNVSCCT